MHSKYLMLSATSMLRQSGLSSQSILLLGLFTRVVVRVGFWKLNGGVHVDSGFRDSCKPIINNVKIKNIYV